MPAVAGIASLVEGVDRRCSAAFLLGLLLGTYLGGSPDAILGILLV